MGWNQHHSTDFLVHAECVKGEGMGAGVRWTWCCDLPFRLGGSRASEVIRGAVDSATLRSLELRGLPLSYVLPGWDRADLPGSQSNS